MTPGRFSEKLGNGKMRKIDGKMLVKDKGSVQMYIMVFVGDNCCELHSWVSQFWNHLAECSMALQPIILKLQSFYKKTILFLSVTLRSSPLSLVQDIAKWKALQQGRAHLHISVGVTSIIPSGLCSRESPALIPDTISLKGLIWCLDF